MIARPHAFKFQWKWMQLFMAATFCACGGSTVSAPPSTQCVPDCANSQACDLGQNPPVCVDLIGAITVTDNPAANSNGFYARGGTVNIPATVVPVTVVLNAGSGTVSSATLSAGSVTGVAGTNTSGNTWAFSVPTTAQTPGSETPLQFTISATTAAGTVLTATEPATAPQLKIDDKGPTVSAVAVQAGVTGQDGNKWFKVDATPTAKLSVVATIVDSGSGFDASTIQLQNSAGTRIDDGAPTAGAGGVFTFHVPQNLVPAGSESLVNFKVIATDHLTNAQTGAATGVFGLDGKPPTITFDSTKIPYPAARQGCSADTTNVFCGHDGAHFWRNETGSVPFAIADGGSGVDATSGICTITGATTCTATLGSGSFSISIDFSKLAVTTKPDGTFTISLTMTARDLVGNAPTTALSGSVDMTRVKWVRSTGIALTGAPVVSPSLNALLVAGTNNTADPIAAIDISATNGGASLWTTGHSLSPVITSVPNNILLDTTASTDASRPTPVLYLNAGSTAYALHVTSTGIDKYCAFGASGVAGSPILFGAGSTSQAIVAAGTQLKQIIPDALAAGGGACDNSTFSFGSTTHPTLGPPSANGSTIYVGYNNSANTAGDFGVASVIFSGGNFSSPAVSNLSLEPSTNLGVAALTPAANLYFGDDGFTRKFYSVTPALAIANSTTAFTGVQRIVAQPVVSGGLVFGETNQLNVYNASTMTSAWTALNAVSAITPPAIGTAAVYLSESAANQIHAIDTATHLDQWVYGGAGTTTISSLTTEPTLGADGTLYFGDTGGHAYAIITDTPPATTAAGDWPHTGFDNCNSNHANNTGFTCQ
jgi:hypothetical protein